MIRGTINATAQRMSREIRGQGRELILAGLSQAAAVNTEAREWDFVAPAYATTLPSSDHNGPRV